VGSRLARRLVYDGWLVHLVTRPESSLQLVGDIRGNLHSHVHDGTMATMLGLVAAIKPDAVFHVASLFLAQHASDDIERLIASNILFPTQLVEAMVCAGCTRLVNISTSWQHYQHAEFNPVNLYAATKQGFEDILVYYTEAYSLKAITLTLFDTYGPGDPRGKVVSMLQNAVARSVPLKMSPGEQLLDLVYIDDIVDALLRAEDILTQQECVHAKYSLSSGRPVNLRHLAEIIEGIAGRASETDWGGRTYRPREVMQPWCPHPPLPGWKPTVALEQGLARTWSDHLTREQT